MTEVALSYRLFQVVKYATFFLLSLNIGFFFAEELATARLTTQATGEGALSFQLFSATLDTIAWVVLLILFELETRNSVRRSNAQWNRPALRACR